MADIFQITRGGYRAAKGWKKSAQDKVLSPREFSALLAAAAGDERKYGYDAYDLFSISGNFGLRQSEALALELDDFKSLPMGYFRVRTLKKRGKQEDRVYAGTEGAKLLSEIVDRRTRLTRSPVLFPFGARTARYLFAFYADKAGISPNVSFHSLRHTAATMMLKAIGKRMEYPERIVAAFLRHKPTTTQVYLEPTAEEMIQAANLKGVVR